MERRIKRDENYSITTDGKVYSNKNGKKRELKQTWTEKRGYIVYLGKSGVSVQLLMAETFLDNPNNYDLVIHINNDRRDNRIENLKWTSEELLYQERINDSLELMPISNEYEKRICEIEEYSDLIGYTVTIDGDVFSYINGEKTKLNYSINKGYKQVTIGSRLNRRITRKVHRFVAEAFIPKIKDKPDINHKDGNKKNNTIKNLEWVDNKENQRHALLTSLKKTTKFDMYDLNNNYIKTFNSPFEILEFLNISSFTAVDECAKGRYKQAYGYIWKKTPNKAQRLSKQ